MQKPRRGLSFAFWIGASLVTLFPIYWMFVISAKSRAELFGIPSFLLTSFYTDNYVSTLTNPTFQKYMINSIVVATSNSLLVTTLALLATYALSRYQLVGKQYSGDGCGKCSRRHIDLTGFSDYLRRRLYCPIKAVFSNW
jgi:multiple sugar transport system permease protein